MVNIRNVILVLLIVGAVMVAQEHNYIPKGGYVPDEKTAITIAEAILVPIYGKQKIDQEKPFHAVLDSKNVWTVEGSILSGSVGGVAIIRLRRQDAQILAVTHGK